MSSEPELSKQRQINTDGGAVIEGPVNTGGGDFVGRDKITITEEVAYTVQGLPNPYLGLSAFRYADRAIYAGRERLAEETVQRLTTPDTRQTLLFITGASGSGKSSFAQAGLIPRLESHYAVYQKPVRHAIFRPSRQPMMMLADALQKLHPALTPEALKTHTPNAQINLLLIDQFEELFIQSEAAQRAAFCDFLSKAPSFADCHTHILITLRVDYLDELYAVQPLWEIAKAGVELRTMHPADLQNAIQKPVQVMHPTKRFAPELLGRLVQDAGVDAALLPLLQVTLAELWKTGRLVSSNYHSLTDAIRQRAELVYAFSDYDKTDPEVARPADEQQRLMDILLGLINVSVDSADRRDTRQRRTRQELENSSGLRSRLIEELVNARLLSAANESRNEQDVEVIDIIHESLIANWDRLKQAIDEQRQQLQRRARFKLWLGEWLRNTRQDHYLLLTDIQLAEAQALVEAQDIEVQSTVAQEFYHQSLTWREEERQKELQRVQALAEAQRRRAQTFRWAAVVSATLALLAIVAAALAVDQRQRARAGELAANAKASLELDPELSILLAQHSLNTRYTSTGEEALRQAMQRSRVEATFPFTATNLTKVVFSPDQKSFITTNEQGKLEHRAAETGQLLHSYQPHPSFITAAAFAPNRSNLVAFGNVGGMIALINLDSGEIDEITSDGVQVLSLVFTSDGKGLVVSRQTQLEYWDVDTRELLQSQPESHIFGLTFSPDEQYLVTGDWFGKVAVWDAHLEQEVTTWSGHTAQIALIAFSPDGSYLATAGQDPVIKIWTWADILSNQPPTPLEFKAHTSTVQDIAFNASSTCLASVGDDQRAILWGLPEGQVLTLPSHQQPVYGVNFDPTGQSYTGALQPCGRRLTTVSANGTLRQWNIGPTYEYRTWSLFHQPSQTLAISPDHHVVAVAGDEGKIALLEFSSGVIQRQLTETQRVNEIAFSPDGHWLATASWNGRAKLWALSSNAQAVITLTGHKDKVLGIKFRPPDGQQVATISSDKTLRLWQTATGHLLKTYQLDYSPTGLAFSPDGNALVSGNDNHEAIILETETGIVTASFLHENTVNFAAFSPQGDLLATGDASGNVTVRSLTSSTQLQHLLAHQGPVYTGSFSADGRLLATVGADGKIVIWNVTTDQPQSILQPHTGPITDIKFVETDDDLLMVATTGSDGAVRFYLVNHQDLHLFANTRFTRKLTDEECKRYLGQSPCE